MSEAYSKIVNTMTEAARMLAAIVMKFSILDLLSGFAGVVVTVIE